MNNITKKPTVEASEIAKAIDFAESDGKSKAGPVSAKPKKAAQKGTQAVKRKKKSDPKDCMNFTVSIMRASHKKLRIRAATLGMTASEMVEEWIASWK